MTFRELKPEFYQPSGVGWGEEMGGKFKKEGTYVYLWLIHDDVWHKPTQYCKAIILQLKITILKKMLESPVCYHLPHPTEKEMEMLL